MNPGDEITVKVLRVDADKQKISLGLKQLAADPWSRVGDTYEAGQLRTGRVTRVAEFGAFVELEPGVEGLIPLSESGVARDADVKKAFRVGGEMQVVVLDVDAAARRMRLSVTAVEKVREADEVREYTDRPDVAPVKGFGSLADKLRDALKNHLDRNLPHSAFRTDDVQDLLFTTLQQDTLPVEHKAIHPHRHDGLNDAEDQVRRKPR